MVLLRIVSKRFPKHGLLLEEEKTPSVYNHIIRDQYGPVSTGKIEESTMSRIRGRTKVLTIRERLENENRSGEEVLKERNQLDEKDKINSAGNGT